MMSDFFVFRQFLDKEIVGDYTGGVYEIIPNKELSAEHHNLFFSTDFVGDV